MSKYQKIIDKLQKQLTALVRRLISEGASNDKIMWEIDKAIRTYQISSKLKEQFTKDANTTANQVLTKIKADFDFLKNTTLNSKDKREILNSFTEIDKSFAKVQNQVQQIIALDVIKEIKKGSSVLEISTLIKDKFKKSRHTANTIANTGLAAYSNKVMLKVASEANISKFKYDGPPAERTFCDSHLGKTYTLKQLQEMNNGQGLPVETYLGGYNCRHFLTPVID